MQDQHTIMPLGKLDNPQDLPLVPHDMAFPSAMAALSRFLGVQHVSSLHAHGHSWLSDIDLFYYMGLSAEAFGLFFDLSHNIMISNLFSSQPLWDCFAFLGRGLQLYGGADIPMAEYPLGDAHNMCSLVARHIENGIPALVFTREDHMLLAIGYKEQGSTLQAWVFRDGADHTNKSFDADICPWVENWTDSVTAIVLVGKPAKNAQEPLLRRALERALFMLTTDLDKSKNATRLYGHGPGIYREWIGYLEDAGNFTGDVSHRPKIDPEIWDLAERRAWGANFLDEVAAALQMDVQDAVEAFNAIHDHMWEINALCADDKAVQLQDTATRRAIINVVKQCAAQDLRAAECLRNALGQ